MKKLVVLIIFGCFFSNTYAQRLMSKTGNPAFSKDTTSFNNESVIKLDGLTKYTDYKVFSILNDTTYIDTTLSLKKDTKFNYLRKDDFELLPFHNMGQTYSKLGYSFENNSLFPLIGMNAKQYNYYKVEDIKYYYIPTPTSEIMYRTGLEQGQVLDAFVTMNTSKQLNFSLAYKGLRSLGKYRNSLASYGNFRATFNYQSKNNTYFLKGHFSSFDFYNDENGGLTEASINYFESNDPNYIDRGRLDVNLNGTNNMFEGKRYFTDQKFTIYSKKNTKERKNKTKASTVQSDLAKNNIQQGKKEIFTKRDSLNKTTNIKSIKDTLLAQTSKKRIDSIKGKSVILNDSLKIQTSKISKDSIVVSPEKQLKEVAFKIGHSLIYETSHYRFKQSATSAIFGDALNSSINDHTSYQKMNNELYVQFDTPLTGTVRVKGSLFNYNYHYNSILYYNNQTIFDKLKGDATAVGADWNVTYGKVQLTADAQSIIFGDITGTSFKAAASFKLDSIFGFKGFVEVSSKTPDFNKLLYQSAYKDYNWQNDFKNEEIKSVGAEIDITKWGNISATYSIVDNYTYFNESSKPIQATETLNYFKVKAQQYFTFRNFTIDNTVLYQKVENGSSFFRVPELVTRNTLYYSNYLFKNKPLYLQTGVTLKYFSSFKANAYNPLLSEFVLQNDTEIGNFPVLDFFVNAQIRRTRLYFKVENFSANFTGRNYYSAPNYPYRDLTVRFGLVWNFFI